MMCVAALVHPCTSYWFLGSSSCYALPPHPWARQCNENPHMSTDGR